MRITLFLLLLVLDMQEVPYKAAAEYEFNLQYEFRNKPSVDPNTVTFSETEKEKERRRAVTNLPFAAVNLKVVKLEPGVTRYKIVDNFKNTIASKKVKEGDMISFSMGFTDDMKDRVKAHEFIVYFVTDDKKPVSRIVFFVEEKGDFLINGEKRGRF